MNTRARGILRLGTSPRSGSFQALYLYGKLSQGLPEDFDRNRLTFRLDTGARFLYLTERMLRYADPGAIELVQGPLARDLAGQLVPETDFDKCLVRVGGYCWTYGVAKVSFLLFEVGASAEAMCRFTGSEARVLFSVVSGEWIDGYKFFHVRETHRPDSREEIHEPILGCDPVLQQSVLLADAGAAGGPAEVYLALDSETVRTVRGCLLAGLLRWPAVSRRSVQKPIGATDHDKA